MNAATINQNNILRLKVNFTINLQQATRAAAEEKAKSARVITKIKEAKSQLKKVWVLVGIILLPYFTISCFFLVRFKVKFHLIRVFL